MEDIIKSKDEEGQAVLVQLQRENEALRRKVLQSQTDLEDNRSHVARLEARLAEASALCADRTRHADQMKALLQDKISTIKEQLLHKSAGDSDELQAQIDKLKSNNESLKKELREARGAESTRQNEQVTSLQLSIDMKDEIIAKLKSSNKTLVEQVNLFCEQHSEIESSISQLRSSRDLTADQSPSPDSSDRVRWLQASLDAAREKLAERNGQVDQSERELRKLRHELNYSKQDLQLKVDTLERQLAQKDSRIQELVNDKKLSNEQLYRQRVISSKLDEDRLNESGAPPAKAANVQRKTSNVTIKDKNELVDMNHETLLGHCLALQFEVKQLLAHIDHISKQLDSELARAIERKARSRQKLESLKEQLHKQAVTSHDQIQALEAHVNTLKMEMSHAHNMNSNLEQSNKRLHERERELAAMLAKAEQEVRQKQRALTAAEHKVRDMEHENHGLQDKVDQVLENNQLLENSLREYKVYGGDTGGGPSPNSSLTRTSGVGISINQSAATTAH